MQSSSLASFCNLGPVCWQADHAWLYSGRCRWRRVIDAHFVRSCRQRMRFQPQRASRDRRLDAGLPPPCGFIAAAVDLAMVSSTQRHGELIANLAPQRAALGKSQMVGFAGSSTTNQARMLGDRSDVIPVTNAARFR